MRCPAQLTEESRFNQGGALDAEIAAHCCLGHAAIKRGDDGVQLLTNDGGWSIGANCFCGDVAKQVFSETINAPCVKEALI
jgi:hypothetical protein